MFTVGVANGFRILALVSPEVGVQKYRSPPLATIWVLLPGHIVVSGLVVIIGLGNIVIFLVIVLEQPLSLSILNVTEYVPVLV